VFSFTETDILKRVIACLSTCSGGGKCRSVFFKEPTSPCATLVVSASEAILADGHVALRTEGSSIARSTKSLFKETIGNGLPQICMDSENNCRETYVMW
jgi:hypothetical protein